MSPIKRPRFGGVFLFCPFEIQPRTSVCSAFCVVHAKFTTSDAKSFTGLCRSFSGYLPHFAPVIRLRILLCCTSCKALEDIQASAAPPPIPDTTAAPDAGQGSADTSPAAGGPAPGQQCRAISPAPSIRRGSLATGRGWRRGTTGGLSPHLFFELSPDSQ